MDRIDGVGYVLDHVQVLQREDGAVINTDLDADGVAAAEVLRDAIVELHEAIVARRPGIRIVMEPERSCRQYACDEDHHLQHHRAASMTDEELRQIREPQV